MLLAPMAEAADIPANAAGEMISSEASEEPRRVLLVEDDDGDALIVSDLLVEAWPVVTIDRVSQLEEAERRLGDGVDCVLLDLGLPDALRRRGRPSRPRGRPRDAGRGADR